MLGLYIFLRHICRRDLLFLIEVKMGPMYFHVDGPLLWLRVAHRAAFWVLIHIILGLRGQERQYSGLGLLGCPLRQFFGVKSYYLATVFACKCHCRRVERKIIQIIRPLQERSYTYFRAHTHIWGDIDSVFGRV